MRPDTDWCLPNMPEGSIQSFSSYAETDRSRLSCTPICYHKQKGRDLLQNKGAPTQTFWKIIWSFSLSIAPSTLTAKLLTRKKASLRNKKTLSCKCDQFDVDNFSLPVSLAASRVPHSFSTGPHQVCRFSFCPVDIFTISCSSHLNGWMDNLVVNDACYILHTLFPACLLVTSWYLVSSRYKCVIVFVCSDSAVRTGRARQHFSMAAGCWLMPVKDFVCLL